MKLSDMKNANGRWHVKTKSVKNWRNSPRNRTIHFDQRLQPNLTKIGWDLQQDSHTSAVRSKEKKLCQRKLRKKNFLKIDLRLGQSIRNLLTLMDIIWLAKFNTIIFRKDDDNILASSIFLCILFWTQLPWRPSSQR